MLKIYVVMRQDYFSLYCDFACSFLARFQNNGNCSSSLSLAGDLVLICSGPGDCRNTCLAALNVSDGITLRKIGDL